MPSTLKENKDLVSMLTPEAQLALWSLPTQYDILLRGFPPESLSPFQIELVSAYVVRTAAKFSSLSTEQKKARIAKSASHPGAQ